MKLTLHDIQENRDFFQDAGIRLPAYDVAEMRRKTKEEPIWLHIGGGNIFRIFIAGLQEELLSKGLADRGIITASCFDRENIDRVFRPYDNLTLGVTMYRDGELRKNVIGSVAEALFCQDQEDWNRLEEIAASPSLQMITLTITEKGYTSVPGGVMDHLARLLDTRYRAGRFSVAVVSMDNCASNGDKLREAVTASSERMVQCGEMEEGILTYLADRGKVSFPWTMIDKITPRPSQMIAEQLAKLGMENMEVIETARKSSIAPFVNAESSEYLVIEDDFPAGKPPLSEAGVFFTERETVRRTERMKVTACLNPLHTALAVYGCLLGYSTIAEEMQDEALVSLIRGIASESIRVCEAPDILSPEAFLEEVLTERFPNPNLPDTPQRIATDTSQKVPIRFGVTIRSYVESDTLDTASLRCIPLALAGWLRYLTGIDDQGNKFERSPDPRLEELTQRMEGITCGHANESVIRPILQDETLFGTDLYQAGIGVLVQNYLEQMLAGPGAVRETLEEVRKGIEE